MDEKTKQVYARFAEWKADAKSANEAKQIKATKCVVAFLRNIYPVRTK